MRRLWAGETVSYNGPAGNYDGVRLPDAVKGKEVPLILAAMLDWEMAALGPGEADLAWWIVMDSLLSEGLELPRLAGLPDRSESIEFYERARGRPVEHIDYYEIFAA